MKLGISGTAIGVRMNLADIVDYLNLSRARLFDTAEVETPILRAISARLIPHSCTSFCASSRLTAGKLPRWLPLVNSINDALRFLHVSCISLSISFSRFMAANDRWEAL
jgi:hypothetical protein